MKWDFHISDIDSVSQFNVNVWKQVNHTRFESRFQSRHVDLLHDDMVCFCLLFIYFTLTLISNS